MLDQTAAAGPAVARRATSFVELDRVSLRYGEDASGTLALQGLVPQRAHDTPIAVTGGTGAYNGARGTALVTDVSKTKTTFEIGLL